MKKILFLTLILFVSIVSYCQLVLTNLNFLWDTDHLMANYIYRQASGISLPAQGENQTWDYSNLVSTGTSSREFVESTNPGMPLAEYYYAFTNYIGSSIAYTKERYLFIDETGWKVEGLVTRSTYCDISSVTGQAGDNLSFPADTFLYVNPGYMLTFPTDYQNHTIDTMITETKFNLTIQAYAYNNIPCIQKQYLITNDLISGFGTIKVPGTNEPNNPYDVVQVKRITTTIDSFYVQGATANPALLSAFGLTQGKITNSYDYYFHRQNTQNYIFRLACNANFSTVIMALWDAELPIINSIENIAAEDFIVYPNPACDIINLNFANFQNYDNVNYRITDQSGKILQSSEITGNLVQINLSGYPAGAYLLHILQNNQLITSIKIIKN